MRWWSQATAPAAAAIGGAGGTFSLYFAVRNDCFEATGGAIGCCFVGYALCRLLMWFEWRISASLHRFGVLRIAVCAHASLVAFLAIHITVRRSNGQLGFCASEIYLHEERLQHAITSNVQVVLSTLVIAASALALETYPLMQLTLWAHRSSAAPRDIEAICAQHGTHPNLGDWTPLVSVVLALQVLVVGIILAIHPSPCTLSLLSIAAWHASFFTTCALLRRLTSKHLRTHWVPGLGGDDATRQSCDDSAVCVVCLDGENTHVAFPCGHQCMCATCAEAMTGQPCPLCRIVCEGVCRVYNTAS